MRHRAINYISAVANRACITLLPRHASEADSLLSSLAVRTGISLFEMCRAVVRRTRP